MVTSSETWSEVARAGADILDLDRYMRGTRPARRAATAPSPRDIYVRRSSSDLVVDAGAAGAGEGARRGSLSASSASEPLDKRYSHDSGLSETSYRHQRPIRRKKVISSIDSRSGTETIERRRGNKSGGEAKERRRRKPSGVEATERRGKKNGAEAERRGSSESNRSFRVSLERALRDQQAQIARVAALCERQARSERRSERSERRKERSLKSGDRRSDRQATCPGSGAGARSSSRTTDLSSSNSSLDPHKRPGSECRTYKIIMSKLDELNRLFAARRAVPAPLAAAGTVAPRTRGRGDSSSVTVSDKVVGTDSRQHTTRQAKPRATTVVAAGAVDIPPQHNVVTESVVRAEDRESSVPASDKGMPGRFHLDDPVRLYKQAKRLDAAHAERHCSASSSSRSSGGSARGSVKGSLSLCALCRCYWTVARRYVATQLTAVRE